MSNFHCGVRWLPGRKCLVSAGFKCHRAIPHRGTYLSTIARQDESTPPGCALGNMVIRAKKLMLLCAREGRKSHSSDSAEIISHANELQHVLGRGWCAHNKAAFAIFSIDANGLVGCRPLQRATPEVIIETKTGLSWKGPFKAILSNPSAISRGIFK